MFLFHHVSLKRSIYLKTNPNLGKGLVFLNPSTKIKKVVKEKNLHFSLDPRNASVRDVDEEEEEEAEGNPRTPHSGTPIVTWLGSCAGWGPLGFEDDFPTVFVVTSPHLDSEQSFFNGFSR